MPKRVRFETGFARLPVTTRIARPSVMRVTPKRRVCRNLAAAPPPTAEPACAALPRENEASLNAPTS